MLIKSMEILNQAFLATVPYRMRYKDILNSSTGNATYVPYVIRALQ